MSSAFDHNTSFFESEFVDEDQQPAEGTGDRPEDRKDNNQLATKESRAIARSKLFLYFFLLAATVATCLSTFLYLRKQEEDQFEHSFHIKAAQIERLFFDILKNKVNAAEALSVAIASHARALEDGRFPFVSFPDFDQTGRSIQKIARTDLVMFVPIVQQNVTADWEIYAQIHKSWLYDDNSQTNQTANDELYQIPVQIHSLLQSTNNEDDHSGNPAFNANCPVWQSDPRPTNLSVVNADLCLDDAFSRVATFVHGESVSALSPMWAWDSLTRHYDFGASYRYRKRNKGGGRDGKNVFGRHPLRILQQSKEKHETSGDPTTYILSPVFRDLNNEEAGVAAFVLLLFRWDSFAERLGSPENDGFDAVVDDSCGSVYTYSFVHDTFVLKGTGDLHDRDYSLRRTLSLPNEFRHRDHDHSDNICTYVLTLYANRSLREEYVSRTPLHSTLFVALLFSFVAVVFATYDSVVSGTQWKIVKIAQKTQTLVFSLFPENVHERVLNNFREKEEADEGQGRFSRKRDYLKDFAEADETPNDPVADKKSSPPIADLFPEATIIFADIVGFTAWSSTREPSQVFELLESVYAAFDESAHRLGVFKVETVGDCYVAVAGLPEPRKDHAIVMAKFAAECLGIFSNTTKMSVLQLGPDTEDLCLRIGLHSGPVTAGVLRGQKSRFQLFGDTMNTASRMESTGMRNRIQVSEETADFLRASGKEKWLRPRRDKVVAKGKGSLQTYWCGPDAFARELGGFNRGANTDGGMFAERSGSMGRRFSLGAAPPKSAKYARLVGWNSDVLSKVLKLIVARRESLRVRPDSDDEICLLEKKWEMGGYVLNEVEEVVRLPHYERAARNVDVNSIELGGAVEAQLKHLVLSLASMYRENFFHNFEHASHVTMSVTKLLSRIVAPDKDVDSEEALHDHTYGITSDPMTQFAVVFSALIHDVDHSGVPNTRLATENPVLASKYKQKSVAEQNSVCIAWGLLMGEEFEDLRRAIYATKAEFMRFRQLVVNIVLATDIMDKDLGALRKSRWQKAFSEHALRDSRNSDTQSKHRKATIVIEHLIQASDVAHTMQHWHIFSKWNKRLFKEMYKAFRDGRADKDPSLDWYESEKGFFDFYVIPLAKKLKDCGVFGVSSDEYLQYATQNRSEWEKKGRSIVEGMLEDYRIRHGEEGTEHSYSETEQSVGVFKNVYQGTENGTEVGTETGGAGSALPGSLLEATDGEDQSEGILVDNIYEIPRVGINETKNLPDASDSVDPDVSMDSLDDLQGLLQPDSPVRARAESPMEVENDDLDSLEDVQELLQATPSPSRQGSSRRVVEL